MSRFRTISPLVWLVLALLLAALCSARLLTYDLLFTDEYLTMRNSGAVEGPLTLQGVVDRILVDDIGGMGIGYHLPLNVWFSLVGNSVLAVRAYSWLFGLLAIALVYRLGIEWFGSQVGLYAALILASSAFFLDYLHEARAYTQWAFLTLLAFWLYTRVYRATRIRPAWLIALSVTLVFLLYTHYISLVIGATLGGIHLLNLRRSVRWGALLAALLVGAASFIPWLGVTLVVIQRGANETSRQAVAMPVTEFVPLLLFAFANANVGLLALAWLFVGWHRSAHGVTLRGLVASPTLWLAAWIVVPLIGIMLVNARIPFMVHVRYLIFLFPAFALVTALGIQQLRRVGVPAWAVLGIWIITGLAQTFNPTFVGSLYGQIYRAPAQGFEQALALIRTRTTPDDVLLYHIAQPDQEPFQLYPINYYVQNTPLKRFDQFELINLSQKTADLDYVQAVYATLDGASTVWTVRIPFLPTTNRTQTVNYVLSTQFNQCEQVLLRDDVDARLYVRKPATPPALTLTTPQAQTLGVTVSSIHPEGDGVRVLLAWQSDDVPSGVYSYSLRLLDAAGNVIAQQDAGVPDARPSSCSSTLFAVDAAADVSVVLYVYDWQTGARLNEEALVLRGQP